MGTLLDGDRIGLMSHNGAGKTTFLRALARVAPPRRGQLWRQSQLSPVRHLLRALTLGVKALVDDIRDFTELGDYLDVPLRTYSSGMAMRLAFVISTTVYADISLMDEWLNVGDDSFSPRAQARLNGLLSGAKILVLASHNLDLIRKNCNTIIRLEHGKITSIVSTDSLQGRDSEDKRAETG